jgi:rRNA maturation RNase YbeY
MKKEWQKIKDEVLGKDYELSLVFAENDLMKRLNERYRKKRGASEVLSFGLSEKMGEIFINKNLKLKNKNYMDYLFIHSLLHLKGLKHGKLMKAEEEKILKKFKINFAF